MVEGVHNAAQKLAVPYDAIHHLAQECVVLSSRCRGHFIVLCYHF